MTERFIYGLMLRPIGQPKGKVMNNAALLALGVIVWLGVLIGAGLVLTATLPLTLPN